MVTKKIAASTTTLDLDEDGEQHIMAHELASRLQLVAYAFNLEYSDMDLPHTSLAFEIAAQHCRVQLERGGVSKLIPMIKKLAIQCAESEDDDDEHDCDDEACEMHSESVESNSETPNYEN